jgi:Flp pilus assembly protein TadD
MYLVQFSPAQAFAAVPILLLTILTILSARRGNPSPLGAWLCYLIILSPTAFYLSPWIQNFADRHTYLSTIPLFLLAGGGVARLYATSMATAQGRILRVALVGILIFLTGWYILLSHRQIPVWQNSISLWTKAVTVSPASAIACDNLGAAIAATGNWTDAAMVFRHAAALDPHLAKAWNNLAIVCENLGEPDSAEHFYRKAIAADPAYDESYILLGGALERAKRWREATALYQGALEKAPSQARLWAGLGHALLGLQRTDSAKSSFTKALALDGNCIEAYVGLGTVLEMEGKADEAEIEYARARALYPGSEPIQGSGR